ncbi:sulfatase [Thermobaculum terrenum ATCC BAA-798]|uniref:Sulfatase n=1 Tax=Thermobaculum terrenum (strain ATCC BAA-798 / CCMEE 7001 / YNP1) TaxID=525904 RepID=D1CEU0_THET1|nr:sulfatase [Thermobaculum terrenum]ACZ41446.1 sulfatase [Thermobaculum terrenum ATCC BAA-798]
MRVLYVDIDSLRPDHLGCYGYHRNTSPNIDSLAREAVVFQNCYISDAPCLPSRTALWSGRSGFHTGVVNHGGVASEPFREGPNRGHRDLFDRTGWMALLRSLGMRTVTVSSFGERHSAWHWYAGFTEIYNPGKRGMDVADEVTPVAVDWLQRNAQSDNWFLHINYWDPHTPYRTPVEFENPFEGEPLPSWLTEEVRQRCWEGYGPHSAQEPSGWGQEDFHLRYPRVPAQIDSMEAVRMWIDGYDVGVRYADEHVGRLLSVLDELRVLDETVVIIGADHGENLGELNVWGDHQTADQFTCRVPLIVRWPGLTSSPRVDRALHYQYDWAATLLELLGGQVPDNWDGTSFAEAFRSGTEAGRPYLVISQNTWSCQRSVRFDNYICLRTYHDGYKQLQPLMLFDLSRDPHEEHDLSGEMPQIVDRAMGMLEQWYSDMAATSLHDVDPMMTVLREGGPYYTRGELPAYIERLRATGRPHHAQALAARHRAEL